MDIVKLLLFIFIGILAIFGLIIGVILYGIADLLGGIIWVILGAAIGIALFRMLSKG